jgi:hypothetical protein
MRPKEALALLNFHWDDADTFAFRDGRYTATARFGRCEVMSSDDPDELQRMIRRHYPTRMTERSST